MMRGAGFAGDSFPCKSGYYQLIVSNDTTVAPFYRVGAVTASSIVQTGTTGIFAIAIDSYGITNVVDFNVSQGVLLCNQFTPPFPASNMYSFGYIGTENLGNAPTPPPYVPAVLTPQNRIPISFTFSVPAAYVDRYLNDPILRATIFNDLNNYLITEGLDPTGFVIDLTITQQSKRATDQILVQADINYGAANATFAALVNASTTQIEATLQVSALNAIGVPVTISNFVISPTQVYKPRTSTSQASGKTTATGKTSGTGTGNGTGTGTGTSTEKTISSASQSFVSLALLMLLLISY